MTEKHFAKFIVYIAKLLQGEKLPDEALDHNLEGEWKNFREFHISGDLLVIYLLEEDKLKLIRIGSHSRLF